MRNWKLIAAALCVLVGAAALTYALRQSIANPSPTVRVLYRVAGEGEGIVTYAPAAGEPETVVVPLPWSLTIEEFPRGRQAVLIVETSEGAPAAACRIDAQGRHEQHSTEPALRVWAVGCRFDVQ